MAVKGWRRSWEMRATILLRAESGSNVLRSDCTPHNDSAGKDRRLHTARSSIQTLPSAMGRSSEREDPFLLRRSTCPWAPFVIYHISRIEALRRIHPFFKKFLLRQVLPLGDARTTAE